MDSLVSPYISQLFGISPENRGKKGVSLGNRKKKGLHPAPEAGLFRARETFKTPLVLRGCPKGLPNSPEGNPATQ